MDAGEIAKLLAEIEKLQSRNLELETRINFFERHPTLARGLGGEKLIAKILNGVVTSYHSPHDIDLPDGTSLEIKSSRLNVVIPGVPTMRWAWAKVFGSSGLKKFDFLLLVGDSDARYRDRYKDTKSPYVFFLVPYDEVGALTTKTGSTRGIQLTTNPLKAKSVAHALYSQFQITTEELEQRFNL